MYGRVIDNSVKLSVEHDKWWCVFGMSNGAVSLLAILNS